MSGPWQYIPGVPAGGHVTSGGAWHPGAINGCRKCQPTTLPVPTARRRATGRYEKHLHDGIDRGHAAWMLYAPDGTVHAGPIASDRDAVAIVAELNAGTT